MKRNLIISQNHKMLLCLVVAQLGVRYIELYTTMANGRVQVVLRAAVIAVFAAIMLAGNGFSKTLRIAFEKTPYLAGIFCVAMCTSLAVGFISENIIRYVASDMLRIAAPWLFFWVSMSVFMRQSQKTDIVRYMISAFAVLSALDAVMTIGLSWYFWGYKISTTLHLYGVGWALFGMNKGKYKQRALVCTLCIVAAIVGGKRGNLIAMPLAAGITYWAVYARLGIKAVTRVVPTIIGVALVVFAILISAEYVERWKDASTSVRDRYFRNVDTVMSLSSNESAEESSIGGRLDEVTVVNRHLRETPIFYLIGAGFGATAKTRYDENTIGSKISGEMHQVHIGWVAYAFRCGILGLILYAGFFIRNVSLIMKTENRYMGPILYYTLIMFILSFKGNVLLEEVSFPIVAALAWVKSSKTVM